MIRKLLCRVGWHKWLNFRGGLRACQHCGKRQARKIIAGSEAAVVWEDVR
jgi:hypothetical protein